MPMFSTFCYLISAQKKTDKKHTIVLRTQRHILITKKKDSTDGMSKKKRSEHGYVIFLDYSDITLNLTKVLKNIANTLKNKKLIYKDVHIEYTPSKIKTIIFNDTNFHGK